MEPAGPFWKLRRPQKKLLDDFDPELDAPVKGPLFPRPSSSSCSWFSAGP